LLQPKAKSFINKQQVMTPSFPTFQHKTL